MKDENSAVAGNVINSKISLWQCCMLYGKTTRQHAAHPRTYFTVHRLYRANYAMPCTGTVLTMYLSAPFAHCSRSSFLIKELRVG